MGPTPCGFTNTRKTPAPDFSICWDGGGDGMYWSDPFNWSTDELPTMYDDVLIDLAYGSVLVARRQLGGREPDQLRGHQPGWPGSLTLGGNVVPSTAT